MTIEALLTENNSLLKEVLNTLQSQQAIVGAMATAEFAGTADKKPAAAKKAKSDAPSPVTDDAAKNEPAQTAAPVTTAPAAANTEPSAQAPADTASAETSAQVVADVTWKQVIDELQSIAQSTEPHLGKDAVKKTMAHFKPGAARVPELEALGKNAEILAYAQALRTPKSSEDDLGI